MDIGRIASALICCGMLMLLPQTVVHAQDIQVPPVTTASPGGYANPLKLDTDRHARQQREAGSQARAQSASTACSADALPPADRRRMEVEYVRRMKADGKPSADAWVREQGIRFHQHLVEQGVCPSPTAQARTSQRKELASDKQGCRMVTRPVAGLGGAPMTMALVPDCD